MNSLVIDGATVSVSHYHQRSKHSITYGYASGPESIDWDSQPNPFRIYDAAPLLQLPLSAHKIDTPWSHLWHAEELSDIQASLLSPLRTLDFTGLAQLLELALGLSAWKQYGTARWSLRCNPSSGNLHPTECYVVVCNIEGLEDGVYHYRADLHALEQRCLITTFTQTEPLLWLGFSSVHWREAWKYGERAYRYCQHDVGHALAAVSFAAKTLNLSARQLSPIALSDDDIAHLFGLNRRQDFMSENGREAEREYPDCLLTLSGESVSSHLLNELKQALKVAPWYGNANILDLRHMYQWPVIDEVEHSAAINQQAIDTIKDKVASSRDGKSTWPQPLSSLCKETAAYLIKQRRSAQAFDPNGAITLSDFYRILDHCLPRHDFPPSNVLPSANKVHLILFVHNVDGLDAGVYALPRTLSAISALKSQLREEFNWQRVVSAPDHLPLHSLLKCSSRRTIAKLSCQQAIAGDSALSLVMLAEFDDVVQQPWQYRHLFWQAGAIGQLLYLEAEAIGLRGTGIGCYFDDAVHDMLGLAADSSLQSLYHFTIGRPVMDNRITTWAPYRQR
jgi:SagB-type dehydrogenase family enzyme